MKQPRDGRAPLSPCLYRTGASNKQGEGAKTILSVLVDAGDTYHQATLLNPAFLREQGISVPDWLAQAFPG